ncbi:uncharacterized protein LOC124273771 isoform X2 [Haliotis rubra]|uniref:uncharacterized protein LOC124273771 isoform X2 n=1 Tax=Haliotis rubra TaxID=36100 RepID=UPI001EE5280C|nr:uncharacterized protein LOC124273771 isoform X2 [Haliotis rubra]
MRIKSTNMMDTLTILIFLHVVYSKLQSSAGNPFPGLYLTPTQYAVPTLHKSPHTTPVAGFMFNNVNHGRDIITSPIPGKCPTPIPIVNRSLSCQHTQMRRLDLSDDQLKQVLSDVGGNYVKDYMATSDDEAQQNFPNMLSLNDMYEDVDFDGHPDDWAWDYTRTKKELLSQLEEAYRQYYSRSYPDSTTTTTTTTMPKSLQQLLFNRTLYRSENHEDIEVKDTGKVTLKPKSENDPGHLGSGGQEQTGPNLIMGNPGKWREINVNIPLRILAQVLPAKVMYPERKRVRRNAVGSGETCRDVGAQTNDGYLHLCSTCAHTTTLGTDRFPRIINEVWCNTDSKGCLHLGGTAHGSCRQTVVYMTMLRKKPNTCMTIIKDGVHYITDEWEKYAQPIKVACECVVDKRSPFAKYVKP